MKFLRIKSKGLLDPKAIQLIGASTKRNDSSKIGQFGSGLNYSITSLVRQNYTFAILSGDDEIKIGTNIVEFGGTNFEQITVNGEPTSLTTSMGTDDWAGAYPFIREIYSNALDNDPESTIDVVDAFYNDGEYTQFIIEATPDVMKVFTNIKSYFVSTEDHLFTHEFGGILTPREGSVVFRKGIRAYDYENPNGSVFSYDLYNIDVNESRVLKNSYAGYTQIANLIEHCTDRKILDRFILGIAGTNNGLLEHRCYLEPFSPKSGSPEFIDAILDNKYYPIELHGEFDDYEKKNRLGIGMPFLKRWLTYCPDLDVLGLTKNSDELGHKIVEPDALFFSKLHDAKTMLLNTSYKERFDLDYKIVKFYNSYKDYSIKEGKVLISEKAKLLSVTDIALLFIRLQEGVILGDEFTEEGVDKMIVELYLYELTNNKQNG